MGIAVRLLLLRYFAASRLSEACNPIRFGSIGNDPCCAGRTGCARCDRHRRAVLKLFIPPLSGARPAAPLSHSAGLLVLLFKARFKRCQKR